MILSGKNQYKLDNVISNKTKGNKDCEERMNEWTINSIIRKNKKRKKQEDNNLS